MSADFTPEKEDLKILTPFKMQVLTNFPYIEADFDALTNYQLLCKIVEYLNKVIYNENEVTTEVTGLYNAYVSLQNYVNTYFDNLDIQTEVNNKLDEMADTGQLADMIAEYIKMQGQLVYNTVSDMKAADNIQNGSFLKTYGFNSINDKGGALYKARTITNEDVIDNITIIALHDVTLVAELIPNDENNIKVFNDNIILGIKNSKVLYLNNDTYNLEVTETISKTNIKIIGNNSKIYTTSDVSHIFSLNNSELYNIEFKETNISDKTKNTILTGNNLKCVNCSFESTVSYSTNSITNVEFNDCVFNSYWREIHMGHGTLNNLKVINCKFTREQDYSDPYVGETRILLYNFSGTTDPLDDEMLDIHGNNLEILNCDFAPTNQRQVNLLNIDNVTIKNNYFNASGLNSSEVGGSDDLVSLDFCHYFDISNNYFGPSGENELDILSSCYGNISNNVFEKPYDYYIIDINWSDYVRTFGENLQDKTLLKSKDVMISNNKIEDSNTYTFNITPSDSIHIYNNDITNNTASNIVLFQDFGSLTTSNPSGQHIKNLDIGPNNVKSTLGDFGRATISTGWESYIIDIESGHLSPDICWYESQNNVTANNMVYVSPRFPCMHGEAGIMTTNNKFRSITPSITTWDSTNNKSVRRGIDFISNRYNASIFNTLFYTGDILDNYPITYVPSDVGNWDNTRTTGTIHFKSW